MLPVHIRWMIRRDMPKVLAIENQCFPHPWTEDDFIRCLRQRNCIGMVAEYDDEVHGFMIYELHKSQLYIINIATEIISQRKGVGTQMIEKLKGKLSHERRKRLLVDVVDSNLDAQLFFKRQGFFATHVSKDFYETENDMLDAYHFEYDLCGKVYKLAEVFRQRQLAQPLRKAS